MNVGRQRHVPKLVQSSEEVIDRLKAKSSFPVLPMFDNRGFEKRLAVLGEEEPLAGQQFAPGTHQRTPFT
jgi:hypothetical protein